jgi:predicted enzyme related to lactoylglutathione lyase
MITWSYAFIDRPAADFTAAAAFWTAVTDTTLSERRGEESEFATLLPVSGGAPWVKLQGCAEGRGGAHIDLCSDDLRADLERATAAGASVVADHGAWAVLRSPAGQLFCLVPAHGEHRDGAARDSRLDQVCIDLAPELFDAEAEFWPAATGWDARPSTLPEFHVVQPPASVPVRLLLQRLDEPRPTSAHLDLACADPSAVRARHERHGARFLHEGKSWLVMADPTGGVYCLTSRQP